ncbi:phosphohydrolase [Kluyvera cryocrescens]|uniref:Phosphohydrolase n=1 Tax=Kluyvera cryocrescens TaxID=580 RepID=A0AAW9C3H8_KLUCR|nr:phosphohydrolase [Kluyvera cryocrescens]MDW3776755.1 phosphohydrolase [Kluyvera cryocrescens]
MDLSTWQQQIELWFDKHYNGGDASHDVAHFRRVWHSAQQIASGQSVDLSVVLFASYFHDLVSLPKNHPDRARSSVLSAERTRQILARDFPLFPLERHAAVAHAIEAHSFSARIAPQTLEAKIVQDADRLEALGAIGLARVFAVSGAMNAALFDADDPFAEHRALDDKAYALDHFQTKLLRLPETMQTAKGREMAQHNADFLVHFMAKLSAELSGDPNALDAEVLRRFAAQDLCKL